VQAFVSHLDNVYVIALIEKHSYLGKVHTVDIGGSILDCCPIIVGEKLSMKIARKWKVWEEEKMMCCAGTTYADIVG